MKSILNNPYRIAGILANCSEKDILKQKSKIKRFSEVGKEITSEYDFSFLNSLQRTNSVIDKAFSDIEQNQNKVVHSLFWFTNLNPDDNTAIQHLVSGNKEKAIEIWDKLTDEKEVKTKNFSAFNNIGTLYLLEDSKEEIKQGIAAKIKLIESENFIDFVHTVADETFSTDKNKQIEILIDELLTQFKNKYSNSETIELFSNCNGTTQKYLSKKFTEEPIHKIETQIEQCTKKRIKDKSNAYKFATDLYSNTKSELTLLKSIVGNTDLQYKMLTDNVAKEILQCSVDYFNESQEQEKSNNYLEEAMKLAKLAESIALNEATKNKVKENISTLEGMLLTKIISSYFEKINNLLSNDYIDTIQNKDLEIFYDIYIELLKAREISNKNIELLSKVKLQIEQLIIKSTNQNVEYYNEGKYGSSGNAILKKNTTYHIAFLQLLNQKLKTDEISTLKTIKSITYLTNLQKKIPEDFYSITPTSFNNHLFKEKNYLQKDKEAEIKVGKTDIQILESKEYWKNIMITITDEFSNNNDAVRKLREISEWKLFRSKNKRRIDVQIQNEKVKEAKNKLDERIKKMVSNLKQSLDENQQSLDKLLVVINNDI